MMSHGVLGLGLTNWRQARKILPDSATQFGANQRSNGNGKSGYAGLTINICDLVIDFNRVFLQKERQVGKIRGGLVAQGSTSGS
jgi:hypothetical protein